MAPLRGFQLRSPSRAALEELERLVAIRSDVLTAGFDCHVIGSIILQRVKGMEALDCVASDEQTVHVLEVLAILRMKLHDDNIENNVEGHAWPKSSAEYHLHWGGVLDGVISKMFAALTASAAVGRTTDNLSVVERLARLAVRWQGPSLEHVLDHKLRTLASSTYPLPDLASLELSETSVMTPDTSENTISVPEELDVSHKAKDEGVQAHWQHLDYEGDTQSTRVPTLADEAYSLPQDKIANIKKLEAGESRTPEMMIADLDNLKVTQSNLVEKLQGLDESFRKIADALDIRDALYSSNFDPPNVKTPTTKARSSRGTSMGNIHGSPASPTSAFASSIHTRPNRNSSISRKWR